MNYLELTIWCRGKCFLICELNMGGKGMVELVVLNIQKSASLSQSLPGSTGVLPLLRPHAKTKGINLWIQGGNRDVVLGVERRDVSRYVFSTIKSS